MKKSPVTGISGAIRIQCLSKADLTNAERHGKRLDKTSQARAISNDPPYTSTGLDLRKLRRQHLQDVFVPKCRTVAKHVIIQFPTDLVDGENPAYMLEHARRAVETIFGNRSIFADRIDRDERGRHVVDIFVAPIDLKKTKHTSRLALTVSRHEEELAEKHDRSATPYGRGQAAQDSIFEYFRDVMKLPNVQRGSPKAAPGPDWQTAEELRRQEIEESKNELWIQLEKAARQLRVADELVAQANADRELARSERESAEATARAASEKERKANVLVEAAEERDRSSQALYQQAEAALANAETKRKENDQRAAALDARAVKMDAAKRQAEASLAKAKALTIEAERVAQAARADREAVRQERVSLQNKRDREKRQLALLATAVEENDRLALEKAGEGFRMKKSAMTISEAETYDQKWSAPLVAIARSLASALERMRRLMLNLSDREAAVAREEERAQAREREFTQRQTLHEERIRQHQSAVEDLDARLKAIVEKEAAAEKRAQTTAKALKVARQREDQAEKSCRIQSDWADAIRAIEQFAGRARLSPDRRRIEVDEAASQRLFDATRKTLQLDAPKWALSIVEAHITLGAQKRKAGEADAERERKNRVLDARIERIDRSHNLLSDIVQNRCLASAAEGVLSLRYSPPGQPTKIVNHRIEELEPLLLYAAETHTRYQRQTERLVKLEKAMQEDAETRAATYPQHAQMLWQETERHAQKIKRAFVPPPGWTDGIGG